MGIKSKILQALGRNSPYVSVLPVPFLVNRAPSTADIMPAGQLFIDTSTTPHTIYTSLGNGDFAEGGNEEATTSSFGIVQLATLAELQGGSAPAGAYVPTANDVATVIAGVVVGAVPPATESQQGIAEIATQSETNTGTDDTKIVTPLKLKTNLTTPPAIGGTTPAAGAFTTLSASGAFSLTGDTVDVAEGGTGASSLTDHGILLGSGTAAVSVTAVGTTGQLLVGQSAADPVWATNIDLPGTLDVTGAATLDSTLDVAGAITGAELDIDNININGNTISSTDTNGNINLTPDGTGLVVAANLSLSTDLAVADGGTGASSLTDHGIMLGSGTAAVTVTAVGTNNQLLIGQTGADPIWTTNVTLPGTLDVPSGLTTLSTLTQVGTANINASGAGVTTIGTGGTGATNIGNATGNTAITGTLTITDPLDVAQGGTGLATLTDHGVLVGSGTGDITPLSVGTNGQLLVGSTGADPVFATASSALSSITNTLGAGTFAQDISENWLRVATVNIATGDILTMATTPIELVAAPGAGKFIEFISAQLILNYNSVPYTEAGDNMAIRYTDGAGVIVSQTIESTGFIDQAADTITCALPKIDAIVAATGAVNQALVLDNTGSNFGAGNSDLIVKVAYRVITTGL